MKFLPRVRRPIAPARGGNRPFLAAEAHAAPVAAAPWLLLQAAAGCPARGSVRDQRVRARGDAAPASTTPRAAPSSISARRASISARARLRLHRQGGLINHFHWI